MIFTDDDIVDWQDRCAEGHSLVVGSKKLLALLARLKVRKQNLRVRMMSRLGVGAIPARARFTKGARMKTLMIALLVSQSVYAVSCAKGCFDYESVCACDAPQPDQALQAAVKPDDAKPPRNPQPEWEVGTVKAINEPRRDDNNLMTDSEKAAFDAKKPQMN